MKDIDETMQSLLDTQKREKRKEKEELFNDREREREEQERLKAQADAAAKAKLTALFPKHHIEQLAIDGIASGGGSIHCATQQEI